MSTIETDPFTASDANGRNRMYARTYARIRTIVGFLAIGLPLTFIVGEALFLRGQVKVRGSISAYYHTSMRDLLVAGLFLIGFLLITYMAGQRRTPDFWFSLWAGIAALGVAFFPTGRIDPTDPGTTCRETPAPADCAPMQRLLGETPTAWIHFGCAAVFIGCLAVVAFLFARRERDHEHTLRSRAQKVCAFVIVGAIVWVVVGGLFDLSIEPLTPLYLGEVVAVWAFAASWLLTVRRLQDGPPPNSPPCLGTETGALEGLAEPVEVAHPHGADAAHR